MREAFITGMLSVAFPASLWADVTVSDRIAQQGYFFDERGLEEKPSCIEMSQLSNAWDYCGCTSEIHYPALSGLHSSKAEMALNKKLRERVKAYECEGKPSKQMRALKDRISSGSKHTFITTFQSERFLSVLEDWYDENAGAAHGLYGNSSMIIDLEEGNILEHSQLFGTDAEAYSRLNDYLLTTLRNMEHTWYSPQFDNNEFVKNDRKDSLVSPDKCDGCSFYINDKARLVIAFNPYAVASFAGGVIELTVPKRFLTNAELVSVLQE